MADPSISCERRVVRLGGALRIGVIGPTMMKHRLEVRSEEYGLLWVVRGQGELLEAGCPSLPLRPGVIFQRFPGRPLGHRYDASPEPLTCFLALPAGVLATLQTCGLPTLRSHYLSLRDDSGLLERWCALADALAASAVGGEARVMAEILAFTVELHARATVRPDEDGDQRWLGRACTALSRHACDRLDTRAVLAPLGGSYAWARRRFRALAGISPTAWRIARRMEVARSLLLGSDRSVVDLARRLGYATPFAFTRQFTRAHGLSPSGFRQQGRD